MSCHGNPQNTISPWIIIEHFFFYETGHLPDTETVDNISQRISCGSRVIFRLEYLAYIECQERKHTAI